MDYATSRPVSDLVPTVRNILFYPGEFFSAIVREGSLKPPIIFAIACGIVSALISGAYDILAATLTNGLDAPGPFGTRGLVPMLVILGVILVLSPLLVLLGVYIGAIIQHLFVWAIFREENSGFERTLRVVAYISAAISLFSWLPVLGLIIIAYGVYLYAIGLRDLHQASFGRAVAAALVPYLLWLGFSLSFVFFTDFSLADLVLESGGIMSGMEQPQP